MLNKNYKDGFVIIKSKKIGRGQFLRSVVFLLIYKNLLLHRIMGRIMALDYGSKRTGIAVTDELKMIASGLTTVDTKKLMVFLTDYFSKENVELLIVGEPIRKDGTPSDIEAEIGEFLEEFNRIFPQIPVERVDERYTSKIAFQAMIDGGLKKKQRRDKALVDQISATIILQQYLY